MDPLLPTFPLFPDPARENVFKKTKDTCGICKQSRGLLYDGPQYGLSPASDIPICPWCIADGSAASRGVIFNDSETQTSSTMTATDAALVEGRTPGFTTWQGNHWLACCSRACIYLGEANAENLQGRWVEAVPSMFEDFDDWSADLVAQTVASIRRQGSPAAYVFQCQLCGKLQGYWDCD